MPSYKVPYLPWAGLFRTSFIHTVGPFDTSRRWMDLSFHARIISLVQDHMHVAIPLYAYRQDVEGQISSISLDQDGHALKSFSLARSLVDEKTARLWLYPLSTTLARQSANLPLGKSKISALSQPIALAPTYWKSMKWILYAFYAVLKIKK